MLPSRRNISNWKRYHELFSAAFIHEALGAVAELEIAEVVDTHPTPVEYIAKRLELDENALYRTMRALAAYGIFEETEERRFRHNSFSLQLRVDHPYSIHGMVMLWLCAPIRNSWSRFSSALRSGKSAFRQENGTDVYQYMQNHPAFAELFHRGMENNSSTVVDAIARGFHFGDYKNVIDLGGGVGTQLVAILKRHAICGAVFDLPATATKTRKYIKTMGLETRAKFIEGNWFESVPSGFDIYLIKNSLWNWSDQMCSRILTNISRSMTRESRLLVIEYLVNPLDAPWSTAFDLQQLNVTGGKGRTREEYEALFDDCGLRLSSSFVIENESVLQCQLK